MRFKIATYRSRTTNLLFCITPSYRSRYHHTHTTSHQTMHITGKSTSSLIIYNSISIFGHDLVGMYSHLHARCFGWVLYRIPLGMIIKLYVEALLRFPSIHMVIEEVFEQSPWPGVTDLNRSRQVGNGTIL